MPELKEPVFKDIPLSFTAHPVTGNVKALTNRDAVKQSVKNIVLTNYSFNVLLLQRLFQRSIVSFSYLSIIYFSMYSAATSQSSSLTVS